MNKTQRENEYQNSKWTVINFTNITSLVHTYTVHQIYLKFILHQIYLTSSLLNYEGCLPWLRACCSCAVSNKIFVI